MEGNPVAKGVVVFVVKCRSHRRCIDRRVICPQGPNQSFGVHRVVKKDPDVSLPRCCGCMQQCTAVVGRVFSAWLRACKSPHPPPKVVCHEAIMISYPTPPANTTPQRAAKYPAKCRTGAGTRGRDEGQAYLEHWVVRAPGRAPRGRSTWHCIPWKRFCYVRKFTTTPLGQLSHE